MGLLSRVSCGVSYEVSYGIQWVYRVCSGGVSKGVSVGVSGFRVLRGSSMYPMGVPGGFERVSCGFPKANGQIATPQEIRIAISSCERAREAIGSG